MNYFALSLSWSGPYYEYILCCMTKYNTRAAIVKILITHQYCREITAQFRVVMSVAISASKVLFVFASSCSQEEAYLIYVICVCLRIVMSNTYCVVSLYCLSSSCVPYYCKPGNFRTVFFSRFTDEIHIRAVLNSRFTDNLVRKCKHNSS